MGLTKKKKKNIERGDLTGQKREREKKKRERGSETEKKRRKKKWCT